MVVSFYLPNTDPLHKISIIPRGRAGGYTLLLPKEDRNYVTRSQMLDSLPMLLGGRVAEAIVLKDISTGAQNDLERVTQTVREMITRYGMSEELGSMTFGNQQNHAVFLGRDLSRDRDYSEATAYAIDKEARAMVDAAYARCESILTEHIDKLHQVAALLMIKETIDADEFYQIMRGEQPAAAAVQEAIAETAEAAPAETAEAVEAVEAVAPVITAEAPEVNISFDAPADADK